MTAFGFPFIVVGLEESIGRSRQGQDGGGGARKEEEDLVLTVKTTKIFASVWHHSTQIVNSF